MNWARIRAVIAKLARWALFSVVFSFLPLTFNYFRLALDAPAWPSLVTVLRGGEIFLITGAMCAAAIGDMIASSRAREITKIISGGASLILLVASSGLFTFVAAKEGQLSDATVLSSSLWIFGGSAFSCAICVMVVK